MVREPVFGGLFLHWSYNTRIGWWATNLFLSRKPVSRLYGWMRNRPGSRRKIASFLMKMGVGKEEAVRAGRGFLSFNDFFTREIDLSTRPLHPDPRVCLAPADGRVLAYPRVDRDTGFRVKRGWFDLLHFLGDADLAERFSGGSLLISRLTFADYHHFHFPDSGVPAAVRAISGRYYAGGPYVLRRLVPFYSENFRMLTIFSSDHFGEMLMMEVGAFTVGSIRQTCRPGARVARGERKGFFELGGSTVVLLFRPGAIEIDGDLLQNSARDLETIVRMGGSLGRVPEQTPWREAAR